MLFVPLPFVIALLLLVFLALVVMRNRDETPANPAFLALLLACAVQSVLLGLRWGYGISAVGYFLPVLAAAMPPLVHAGVRRLVRSDSRWQPARVAAYFLPPFLIGLLVIFWRDVIDYALIAIYLGYAVALLLFLRSGPDTLRLAPFEGVVPVYRAVIFAAGALCLSAAVDILILFDVHRSQGAHILTIINIANLLGVFVLGMAAAVANQSRPPIATVETLSQTELDEDGDTLVHIDALMQDKKIYRDANLNLDRLSRKAAIPARRISTAINRALAKNVSQYVNDYRISEACRLLVETDRPVTEIMFDVGFQTKSNFNREFRRVTETNPLAWREGKVGSA